MHRTFVISLAFGVLATLSTTSAQVCIGPDGLDGPCWGPVTLALPDFPGTQCEGTGICWRDCDPQPQECVQMVLGNPVPIACGQLRSDLRVSDCAGNALLGGSVVLDYTRTWNELATPTDRLQVWRFVAKVDLRPVTPGIAPSCLVPPCLLGHPSAFYYGYVDFAQHCGTGAWEQVTVLFHNCDDFIHDQGFSDRPGTFHPETTFALVCPSTSTHPFVASNLSAPGGTLVAEAVRQAAASPTAPCIAEDPVQGELRHITDGCGCQFRLNPKQLSARRLVGSGSCVDPAFGTTTFRSVRTTPAFPWFHMMSTSIGSWTLGTAYPGRERCWVDEVPVLYGDSCVQKNFGEIYYGASTLGGYAVATPSLTDSFLDLASNASFSPPNQPTFPFAGSVGPTRNLIYVNTQ